jgi:hypothetical protein
MPVSDSFDLLIGNHYFPPDCNVTITDNCLNILEQYRLIMLRDFNVLNYDWINGVPLPNFYDY